MLHKVHSRRLTTLMLIVICVLAVVAPQDSAAADTPQVILSTSKAGPRAVENLTERSILRDYKFAWASIEQALESDSTDTLNGPFAGNASICLNDTVMSQRRSGIRSRYLNQSHKLEAVFYAPEGDVIELHDTADYQLQILDGAKTIHDEHVVAHYVVLMTPASDRWVVRQLQSVPQF
jgi:hypothetical protein